MELENFEKASHIVGRIKKMQDSLDEFNNCESIDFNDEIGNYFYSITKSEEHQLFESILSKIKKELSEKIESLKEELKTC